MYAASVAYLSMDVKEGEKSKLWVNLRFFLKLHLFRKQEPQLTPPNAPVFTNQDATSVHSL